MTSDTARTSLVERLEQVRERLTESGVLTYALVLLGPILVALTVIALEPLDAEGSGLPLRLILLLDLVYILVVATLIFMRISTMLAARRANSAGSKLHLRLTSAFAILALIPTVLVAVFAVISINIGLEGWFSQRVGAVLSNSFEAANAYKDEHIRDVTRDAQDLAGSLNEERESNFFMLDGQVRQYLDSISAETRELSEIFVIDGSGEIRVRGPNSYRFDFEAPSQEQIARAEQGGIELIEDWQNNEFRAIIALSSFQDRLLYVTRPVDGDVLALLDETRETVNLYNQLEADRGRLFFEFGLLYLGFALILILAAVWLGLSFAERLANPIGSLVSASRKVGEGDLDVQVAEVSGDDEIALLGRNFNQMTRQLKSQREALVQNTAQIERRRRLFDSVLSSVTSGVIGLDASGRIAFVNKSASGLLELQDDPTGLQLGTIVPEFDGIYLALSEAEKEVVQEQIVLKRNDRDEILLVRMSTRRTSVGHLEGYVLAFDDVTSLVSAQRMAAWGDVARRIAHEIKNPLTPIQLSAERIKRKFAPKLGDDSDALSDMTDVIVRQTNDLRYIVDEFSRFARMPEPRTELMDIVPVVESAVSLQVSGQPEVQFHVDLPTGPLWAHIDATMFTQALTNLIKNAGEAIETYRQKFPHDKLVPEIHISMAGNHDNIEIQIADNGIGLPEDRSRLFEPYFTTRDKGTGLGLPIVKKLVEEHNGDLSLRDAKQFPGQDHFGAEAILRLPLVKETDTNTLEQNEAAE